MSGSEDGKIYMWDLQSKKLVSCLEGHSGGLKDVGCELRKRTHVCAERSTDVVLTVACHPARNMMASASIEKDLTIRIWEDEDNPVELPAGEPLNILSSDI